MDYSFNAYAKFYKKLTFTRWYSQMRNVFFFGKFYVPTKWKVRIYADYNTF